jgi:hypothetical protein
MITRAPARVITMVVQAGTTTTMTTKCLFGACSLMRG